MVVMIMVWNGDWHGDDDWVVIVMIIVTRTVAAGGDDWKKYKSCQRELFHSANLDLNSFDTQLQMVVEKYGRRVKLQPYFLRCSLPATFTDDHRGDRAAVDSGRRDGGDSSRP